jgi:hypothetical protein
MPKRLDSTPTRRLLHRALHLPCWNTNYSTDPVLGGLSTTTTTASLPTTLDVEQPRGRMQLQRRLRSVYISRPGFLRAVTTATTTAAAGLLLQEVEQHLRFEFEEEQQHLRQHLRQLLRLNVTATATTSQHSLRCLCF